MDNDRIDQIIDKHQLRAQFISFRYYWRFRRKSLASQGSIGEGRRKIAGSLDPDTAYRYLLKAFSWFQRTS